MISFTSKVAFSQDGEIQPWSISCAAQGGKGPLICSMTQSLFVKESGQRVMTATIITRPDLVPVFRIALPHGIDLTKAVSIQVDALEAKSKPIGWADQAGSYVEFEVDDVLLAQMKAGTKVDISLTARGGSLLKWELSLAGFTSAFAKLN